MRPVCVPCKAEYWCIKNEATVEQTAGGRPYKLWSGDLWQCPGCDHKLVIGFASRPLAESHQTDLYESYRSEVIVSVP
jgi:hypothetical protein